MNRAPFAAALLLSIGPVAVQRPTSPSIETPHLTIVVTSPARAVPLGTRAMLRLDITPKPKMHVYAPAQQDYIPVSLQIEKSTDYTARPAVFPAPQKFFFEPLKETQLVYSRPFRITQEVAIARTPAVHRLAAAVDASLTVSGTLRYQACDDTLCYPPRNVPVRWTVPIR